MYLYTYISLTSIGSTLQLLGKRPASQRCGGRRAAVAAGEARPGHARCSPSAPLGSWLYKLLDAPM